jgi:hypothetical protein
VQRARVLGHAKFCKFLSLQGQMLITRVITLIKLRLYVHQTFNIQRLLHVPPGLTPKRYILFPYCTHMRRMILVINRDTSLYRINWLSSIMAVQFVLCELQNEWLHKMWIYLAFKKLTSVTAEEWWRWWWWFKFMSIHVYSSVDSTARKPILEPSRTYVKGENSTTYDIHKTLKREC